MFKNIKKFIGYKSLANFDLEATALEGSYQLGIEQKTYILI